MAISRLKSTIISVIGSRKEEIAKAVYNYESKVRDIERKLDSEGNISSAMNDLRNLFRYNLSSDDYRKIEKEIGYNVK